jgi:hypothetical protein
MGAHDPVMDASGIGARGGAEGANTTAESGLIGVHMYPDLYVGKEQKRAETDRRETETGENGEDTMRTHASVGRAVHDRQVDRG